MHNAPSGLLFILIQLVLMVIQLAAAVISVVFAGVVLVGFGFYKLMQWGMPILYRKAIEWRFK